MTQSAAFVPQANIANGASGSTDSTGTVFTFGTLSAGSLATLTATTTDPKVLGSYYLQITGANGTPGSYQILSINSAAASAAVVSPGGNYKTGDVLTVVGGVFSTPSTWTVTQVGGGVTSLALSAAGSYTVLPPNPVQLTNSATGRGCTANITWAAPTLGLAKSAGATASNIVWNLQQSYQVFPPGFANIMLDNNGYQLDQQGGLTMICGQLTTSSTTTALCLTTSSSAPSMPCKFVNISPAAHNITIGSSAIQSLSYLATAPLFVSLPVSDVSQIWVVPGNAGDVVGWAAFN
jgi:hypothetical protein